MEICALQPEIKEIKMAMSLELSFESDLGSTLSMKSKRKSHNSNDNRIFSVILCVCCVSGMGQMRPSEEDHWSILQKKPAGIGVN